VPRNTYRPSSRGTSLVYTPITSAVRPRIQAKVRRVIAARPATSATVSGRSKQSPGSVRSASINASVDRLCRDACFTPAPSLPVRYCLSANATSVGVVVGRPDPPRLGQLKLAQCRQFASEIQGRCSCQGVVVTEDSPTPAQRVLVQGTGPFVLAEHGAIDSEVCGRCQRRRMIVAENLPPARQRVLLQRACLLMSAQYAKFDGKVTCRNECVRVVVAKDSAAPHESVLMEAARLLVFTHFAQVDGETAGELKGVVGRVRSGTCR
jgi:hypothetical protein